MAEGQRQLGPKPYLLADQIHAGYNQRMTDIQGALGAAQMGRASDIITERRNIAAKYDAAFVAIENLKTPFKGANYEHGYQSYPCRLSHSGLVQQVNDKRNNWMEILQNYGISTRPSTHAVHMLKYYAEKYSLRPEDFPNAYRANHCSISLPLFHGMSSSEIDTVISLVNETFPKK